MTHPQIEDPYPSNLDLKHAFEAHAGEDAKFQQEQKLVNDNVQTSLTAIHEKLKEQPTKTETADIVERVIRDLLLSNGKLGFRFVIGLSLFIGALVVIFGGLKTVLGWIGFTLIK